MKHYLGIDIGTFETKGVIVSATGEIVAQAARPHKMQVPQPGWLNFAITGKALAAIRRHLRQTERAELIALGRKLYDDIVRRLPAPLAAAPDRR